MLSKKYRLTTKEIDLLMKGAKSKSYPLFSIKFNSKVDGSGVKFGVSVPNKLFKTATERNLTKRRIYEAIGSAIGGASGLDNVSRFVHVLFVCKPTIIKAKFSEIRSHVEHTLKDVGVI
jgi:ribonuclease P protein component